MTRGQADASWGKQHLLAAPGSPAAGLDCAGGWPWLGGLVRARLFEAVRLRGTVPLPWSSLLSPAGLAGLLSRAVLPACLFLSPPSALSPALGI